MSYFPSSSFSSPSANCAAAGCGRPRARRRATPGAFGSQLAHQSTSPLAALAALPDTSEEHFAYVSHDEAANALATTRGEWQALVQLFMSKTYLSLPQAAHYLSPFYDARAPCQGECRDAADRAAFLVNDAVSSFYGQQQASARR